MIDNDIQRLETDSPILPHVSLKSYSNWNEFHSKLNVTQNETLLKIECHSKWNVTQNGTSIKMKCYSK